MMEKGVSLHPISQKVLGSLLHICTHRPSVLPAVCYLQFGLTRVYKQTHTHTHTPLPRPSATPIPQASNVDLLSAEFLLSATTLTQRRAFLLQVSVAAVEPVQSTKQAGLLARPGDVSPPEVCSLPPASPPICQSAPASLAATVGRARHTFFSAFLFYTLPLLSAKVWVCNVSVEKCFLATLYQISAM